MGLLKNLIKEEARIHTSLFGKLLFFIFPVLIFVVFFFLAVLTSIFQILKNGQMPYIIVHFLFVFLGLNVGAFGLYGSEFMNRRFGNASLLAYSSRILPISERMIYLNVIVKDIIFYLILFILPSAVGVWASSGIAASGHIPLLRLFITASLSFLVGLSSVFFLSTLYAYSNKILAFFVLACVIAGYFLKLSFPPYDYFLSPNLGSMVYSILLILIPSALSIMYLKVDFGSIKERYANRLADVPADKRRLLLVKDFLDLRRSRGGLGRIVFSMLIPAAIIWVFLRFFVSLLPMVQFLPVFAIFMGTFASSIYSWLSEYDAFSTFSILPMKVSDIIESKIRASTIISVIVLVIFIIAAIARPAGFAMLLASLLCMISLFYYSLALTVELTGLYPNVIFFNAKVLMKYIVLLLPFPLLFILLSVFRMQLLFLSPLLLLVAFYKIRIGKRRWDLKEQRMF